jgi:hypothetical protein
MNSPVRLRLITTDTLASAPFRAPADVETFAHTYSFDDLYLTRRDSRVAMPVSGHCTIAYDSDGGWHVEAIFLDAWSAGRTPAKASPILLTENPPNGVKCPLYRLVHDALMISEKEHIDLEVRECIRQDGEQ